MLHLPDTEQAVSKSRARANSAIATRQERKMKDAAAHARLCDLECQIIGAKTLSSILAVLASKLAQEVMLYRNTPDSFTAARMAHEIDDSVDQVLYVAYEVEQMLDSLKKQYLAPLDDKGGMSPR